MAKKTCDPGTSWDKLLITCIPLTRPKPATGEFHCSGLSKGSIQSISGKFNITASLEFKVNVPTLAETAFTVNAADVVGSIGNDLYISTAIQIE